MGNEDSNNKNFGISHGLACACIRSPWHRPEFDSRSIWLRKTSRFLCYRSRKAADDCRHICSRFSYVSTLTFPWFSTHVI